MWNVVCNVKNKIDNEYYECFSNLPVSKQGGRADCEVLVELRWSYLITYYNVMGLHIPWHPSKHTNYRSKTIPNLKYLAM